MRSEERQGRPLPDYTFTPTGAARPIGRAAPLNPFFDLCHPPPRAAAETYRLGNLARRQQPPERPLRNVQHGGNHVGGTKSTGRCPYSSLESFLLGYPVLYFRLAVAKDRRSPTASSRMTPPGLRP